MEYLKVKNWEKYQHYTHRNPPWIKLHNQILDDYEYCCLQDDSKLLLISLFLLASKTDNKIPSDPEWIRSKAMIKGSVDLSELIKSNFIEQLSNGLQGDSIMIASCKQNGGTEKSRVDKNRNIVGNDNGYSKENAIRIISYLNKKTGKNFKETTDKTLRLIKARFNENFKLEDFKLVIDNQTAKWKSDPKMVDYLRPETLFGTKFESYLQTKPAEIEQAVKAGVPDYAD
uniref:Putative replication protein n=1 Tax=viral metagenome TaxID=1070528 RepID=A0A6M3LRJ7_9ZZZZ